MSYSKYGKVIEEVTTNKGTLIRLVEFNGFYPGEFRLSYVFEDGSEGLYRASFEDIEHGKEILLDTLDTFNEGFKG